MERLFKSLEEIAENISKYRQILRVKEVEHFVDLLMNAKRVFVYGVGRSGLMVKAFAQRLMHVGYEVYVIGETINPSVKKGDIVVVVSGSGETTSSVCIGRKAKEVGAILVVLTSHPESTLGRMADLMIYVLGKTKLVEKETYAPFTTLFDITTMALLDSIVSEIMGRKGIDESVIMEMHANVE
jgi:6-phospho 3-hexuloisomerase